jgi:CHAD domain-containing protein
VLERVAERRAADVLGEAMERPWSHLERLCGRLADDASDEELHEARIRAKRVRYAAEALAPVFGKPARRFARRAETLQTVLGTHQDAVMAIAWLREQAGASSPAASFSAGRLAGLEAAVRDEARRTWPDAWADLRRARLRFWE